MKHIPVLVLSLLMVLFAHPTADAVDGPSLSLFSRQRAQAAEKPVAKQQALAPRRIEKKAPAATRFMTRKFLLKGTAVIGSRHIAILQEHGKSEEIVLSLTPGRTVPIPLDPRYHLVEVRPRSARIRYPLSSPCSRDDPGSGIRCVDNGRFALLSIVRARPTPPATRSATAASDKRKAKPGSNIIGTFPDMKKATKKPQPFIGALINAPAKRQEALRKKRLAELAKDENYQKRKKQYKNFKPRRIKEEDIPPGMKVMTTPFGDVLVPR